MAFNEDNAKERLKFVKLWAEYVRTHDDQDWSAQQNIIINSALRSSTLTKAQYLALKEEGKKYKPK